MYYRQYGVIRLSNLVSPVLKSIEELSRDAVLHVYNSGSMSDIDVSRPLFSKYNKRIITRYSTHYVKEFGNPRLMTTPIRELTMGFHRTNRNFKYDISQAPVDSTSLLVYNYSYLSKLYRYTKNRAANYNMWRNGFATMWANICELSTKNDKNHFVFIKIDGDIPTRAILNNALRRNEMQVMRLMNSETKRFLFELWKWIDPETRESSLLDPVGKVDYSKINLILTRPDNTGIVLNVGKLNGIIDHVSISSTESQRLAPVRMRNLMAKFFFELSDIDGPRILDEDESIEQITHERDDKPTPLEDEIEFSTPKDLKTGLDEEQYSDTDTDLDELVTGPTKETLVLPKMDADEDDIYEGPVEDLEVDLKAVEKEMDEIDAISSKFEQLDLEEDEIVEPSEGEDDEDILDDEPEYTQEEVLKEISVDRQDNQELKVKVEELAEEGNLNAANYKKLVKEIEEFTSSKDPYGSGLNRTQAAKVSKEDVELDAEKTKIVSSDVVMDQSMNESTLMSYDYDYITKVAKKDTLNMVSAVQRSGVVVRKHEVEEDNSILGDVEHHTIELRPIDGVVSTLHVKVPKVSPSGEFTANGNKYVMRKQRVDLPIRKINPYSVALTSYYGKSFVRLSQKKAYNSVEYISRMVDRSVLEEDSSIVGVDPADVFNNLFDAPYIYNALAAKYKTIATKDLTLSFDESERHILVGGKDNLAKYEKAGEVVVGVSKTKEPVTVDKDDQFYMYKKGTKVPIGNIYRVLDIDEIKAPVSFSELSLFGKTVPVGVALGYYLGFRKLLALLKVPYRVVKARRARDLKEDEYAIIFKNLSYIFSRKHVVASYILGGFIEYRNSIRLYNSRDFNKKDVYFNILADRGLGVIYVRELDLINEMFVDPITREILEDMEEPTTFIRLLLRATELLQTYHHPDPQDFRYMRIRGYERISGAIYTEMVRSVRSYRHRNISGRSKVEMGPYDVWQRIMKDSANKIVEDINPVQNLKEQEVVTYVGEGGRSKDAIVKKTREYHPTDMGVISEATVDSSDVGVNAYLSSDPNITSLRGLVDVDKPVTATSKLSTSANLIVGADKDIPTRINFISIQNSHVIACDGYHQPQVRTGYEYVMPSRVGPMFCYTAKEDGKIISLEDTGLVVQYKSGRVEGVELGMLHGRAEGTIYPQEVVAIVKQGQSVKKGDAIAYNTGYFEQDILDPSKIVYKYSKSVKVALYESPQTFEDSCAISKEMSGSLTTRVIQERNFTLGFDQAIAEVVRIGTHVEPNDILLVIQDQMSTSVGGFDEESLATLRKLSRQAPRARHMGVVDRIEVYYNGDKRDMHPSLKNLADNSDRRLSRIAKSTGRSSVSGKVNDSYRVAGTPLAMDQLEIKVYIITSDDSAVGDKLIFGAQGKSTVGEVMDYTMTTSSGDRIDAAFGYRSFMNRVVYSAYIIGTSTTLLDVIAKKAYELYKK